MLRPLRAVRRIASDDGRPLLDRIAAEADFEPDPRKAEVHGWCGGCLRDGPR